MHHDFTGMLPIYPFYIYTSKHQNGMYPDVPRLKHLKAFLARWKPIILIPGWIFLGKIYRKPMAFPMLPLSWRTKTMDFTIKYGGFRWKNGPTNPLIHDPSYSRCHPLIPWQFPPRSSRVPRLPHRAHHWRTASAASFARRNCPGPFFMDRNCFKTQPGFNELVENHQETIVFPMKSEVSRDFCQAIRWWWIPTDSPLPLGFRSSC